MKSIIAALFVVTLAGSLNAAVPWAFRPPAVPLVTHDPYFSIWSASDRLTDSWPKHWTGTNNGMCGMARIDGKAFRFLSPNPQNMLAMNQTGLRITPTSTIATFEDAGIKMAMTFTSPLLPNDLDVLARPVTYVTFYVSSTDSKPHDVQIYLDAVAESTVHTPDQVVAVTAVQTPGLATVRAGSVGQPVLGRAGDATRIDWGHLYLSTSQSEGGSAFVGEADASRDAFAADGTINTNAKLTPRPAYHGWPVLGCSINFGKVQAEAVSRHLMIAYDSVYAVEYLGERLRPYWRKNIESAEKLLEKAENDYARVSAACQAFDAELTAALTKAGGEKYAQLCALAYREAIAGHGLAASADGRPFMFAKENSSNGCIGTVDVIYPAAPVFLLLSPELMEANLAPVMEYAALPRWKFPFAPHDLGTYPLANGQVYGGGEKTEADQMPVEESANMLILIAALEKATGKPSSLAKKHLPVMAKWAEYLKEKGLDPENQLCTDDFAGKLAHNVNLSAKAVVALGAYAQVCENHGEKDQAKQYHDLAKQMATKWIEMAADGDHTRLAFDKPGTWSQKYNLIWDKVLGLDLFPPEVAQREVAFYKTKLGKYGIPLDNRKNYTKLDWCIWSASMADNPADFAALADPCYDLANETPDRVPLTDWYYVDSGKFQDFKARPVVGGLFMKMLTEPSVWKNWASRNSQPKQ